MTDGARTPAQHEPVLADETIAALATRADGVYVDATVGRAGHATLLLERLGPSARLIAIDRDPEAVAASRELLAPYGGRAVVTHATFRELPEILRANGVSAVDGILADLGVSSPQIDEPERGFSLRSEGPIDMRADPTSGPTAAELIASLDERALADLIWRLGEERKSRRIARVMKEVESRGDLCTTADLRQAVHRALGIRPRAGSRGYRGPDPATRTFQALRIAVNDELGQLDALLAMLPELLAPAGRAAILSYHSLEDRRVKNAMRQSPSLRPLTKKPVVASQDEIRRNPRARSAKLRVCARVGSP